mmetsp:Transcript_12009/g.16294  ORF Transcript_12009/g.16294 Transcript_12009/m.16294 type:complete len:686 (+) Transcript_12009:291-2348(+)
MGLIRRMRKSNSLPRNINELANLKPCEQDFEELQENHETEGDFSAKNLIELAQLMQKSIVVKDRRYHLRHYPKCFTGEDAVRFLVHHMPSRSVLEAVQAGNSMIYLGLFHHVSFEFMLEDRQLFYRFAPLLPQMNAQEHGTRCIAPAAPGDDSPCYSPMNGSGRLPTAFQTSPGGRLHSSFSPAPPRKQVSSIFSVGNQAGQSLHAVQRSLNEMQTEMRELAQRGQMRDEQILAQTKSLSGAVTRLQSDLRVGLKAGAVICMLTWMGIMLCACGPAILGHDNVSLLVMLLLALGVIRIYFLNDEIYPISHSVPPPTLPDSPLPRAPVVPTGSSGVMAAELTRQRTIERLRRDSPPTKPTAPPESHLSPARKSWPSTEGETGGERSEDEDKVTWSSRSEGDPSWACLPVSDWPQRPVLLQASPQAPALTCTPLNQTPPDSGSASSSCPPTLLRFDEEFSFESEVFKGTAIVNLNKANHQLQWIVQGVFKRGDIQINQVKTGHFFYRPLKLPVAWLVSVCMAIAKSLFTGLESRLSGPRQHVLAPLVLAADVVAVWPPGVQPPALGTVVDRPQEDARGLSPVLEGLLPPAPAPVTRSLRLKALKSLPLSACFHTDRVHTFELSLGQVYVNMNTWECAIPAFPSQDLCKVANRQPFYVMACICSKGKDVQPLHYLFNFELWHERLFKV